MTLLLNSLLKEKQSEETFQKLHHHIFQASCIPAPLPCLPASHCRPIAVLLPEANLKCKQIMSLFCSKYFNSSTSHSRFRGRKKKVKAFHHNLFYPSYSSPPLQTTLPYSLCLQAALASCYAGTLRVHSYLRTSALMSLLEMFFLVISQSLPPSRAPGLFKC